MMNFFMKKLLQMQIRNLPKDQQEAILRAFDRDPAFFKKIADEIQEKVKAGADKNMASMTVMMKYKDKMRDLMK